MLHLTTALHQVPQLTPVTAPPVRTRGRREDGAWGQVRRGRWRGQMGEHVRVCLGMGDRAAGGKEPAVEHAAGPIPGPRPQTP